MKSVALKNQEAKSKSAAPLSKSLPLLRIIKIATCPSLSSRSTLTYQIGCIENSDGKVDIRFRIKANTSRGFFSKEWISTNAIQAVFEKLPADSAVSSMNFNGIFSGKSVNTSGFLLAVLKAEGLMVPVKGKHRSYLRGEPIEFADQIKRLVASSISLNDNDKPVPAGNISKKAIQTAKTKAS
jgi:hypothetical protein